MLSMPFPRFVSLGATSPLPADFGGYQSFPTMAAVGDELVVAFRRGYGKGQGAAEESGHGPGGDIHLLRSRDLGASFSLPEPVLAHIPGQTNEHDALLSLLGDGRLALVTRSHGPEVFANRVQFSDDGGRSFTDPVELAVTGGYGAFFGHLVPLETEPGQFLGTVYNGTGVLAVTCAPGRLEETGRQGPVTLPVRWTIHRATGWPRLNETSLARLSSGTLLAVSRQQPIVAGLHVTSSRDEGRTFLAPRPMGVIGEAPSLLALPDNGALVLFRDIDPDRLAGAAFEDPDIVAQRLRKAAGPEGEDMLFPPYSCAVSLVYSPDGGTTWSEPFVLARYEGGRYHGGYGDLLLLPDGSILAVYHLAPRPGDVPVLACRRFRLD